MRVGEGKPAGSSDLRFFVGIDGNALLVLERQGGKVGGWVGGE